MIGTAGSESSHATRVSDADLDQEIQAIDEALKEHGLTDRAGLERITGGRYWGERRSGRPSRSR